MFLTTAPLLKKITSAAVMVGDHLLDQILVAVIDCIVIGDQGGGGPDFGPFFRHHFLIFKVYILVVIVFLVEHFIVAFIVCFFVVPNVVGVYDQECVKTCCDFPRFQNQSRHHRCAAQSPEKPSYEKPNHLKSHQNMFSSRNASNLKF